MAASKSEGFVDEDKRKQKTTWKQTKRLPYIDNAILISTRITHGLKRWKFLQNKIAEKQEKIERIGRSKHLELYTNKLDKVVEHMKNDIPDFQKIFDDDDSNAFQRTDITRATTGGMGTKMRDNNRYGRTKEYEHSQSRTASTEENEKDAVKEECKRLQNKLEESKNEKAALKISHEQEVAACKEETKKLNDRLEKMNKDMELEVKTLKTQYKSLEAEKKRTEEEFQRYMENLTKSEDIKTQLETKIVELKRSIEVSENEKVALKLNHKEEVGALKLTITQAYEKKEKELNRKCDELETDIASLEDEKRRSEQDRQSLVAKTNLLTNQLDNERKAKEDALIRLSSMASNKLRDNNPNIADLSDPNRPTKLAEQFSELYDNEWTDAFDELEKQLSDKGEKEIISYLRDIILEIHLVCSELSKSKLTTIEEAFVKPSVPSDIKIPSEIFKIIKDGIKSMAPKLLDATKEFVLCRVRDKYKGENVAECLQHQNVKRYIDKCTEVCWYMSVQDPQVVIDGSKSPDDKFDSNRHREYTKKGQYEEYVVWPVLYLYKDGQMLSKGVAQGIKEMREQQ